MLAEVSDKIASPWLVWAISFVVAGIILGIGRLNPVAKVIAFAAAAGWACFTGVSFLQNDPINVAIDVEVGNWYRWTCGLSGFVPLVAAVVTLRLKSATRDAHGFDVVLPPTSR